MSDECPKEKSHVNQLRNETCPPVASGCSPAIIRALPAEQIAGSQTNTTQCSREILFVLPLQMPHMRFFRAQPCHHANDGATDFRSSNKTGAPRFHLGRPLPAFLALSALIFFPITADATIHHRSRQR